MRATRTYLAALVFAVAAASVVCAGRAKAAGPLDAGGADDGGADEALETDASKDPAIAAFERETSEVRALAAGRLDAAIAPASLFDVPLGDEPLVRVDAARLRDLLRSVDDRSRQTGKPVVRARPHGLDASVEDAGADLALLHARTELDRARLAFYELPEERRRDLVAAQEARRADAEAVVTAAQRREQEAEDQRQAALHSAQTARTEAERLVSSELARLLDVEGAQAVAEDRLAQERRSLAAQADVTLQWRQRAIEARAEPGSSADETYEDVRRVLRASRASLAAALDRLSDAPSEVPLAGADALAPLHLEVDTTAVRKERERVEATAQRLKDEEGKLRRDRASQLFDEIDTLNRERLGLLGSLSPAERGAVTGFTAAGWDQASSEARQLGLILRYHRYAIGEWLLALRHPTRALGGALAGGALEAIEWLLALSSFVWWRRRSTALVRLLCRRAEDEDRRSRLPAPSPASRLLAFVSQVHRPLEWLALLFVLRWFLPTGTQAILEVHVLLVLMMWIFGAAFAVDAINALAGAGRGDGATRPEERDRAALRLRSLRLVARVIVVFGLILVISSMLVGRGTIFHWVFSTCWLASLPLLFVLVSWWRPIVFRRTERVRKPTRIQRWVLDNRTGWWTSFAAAAVGAAYLFASGAARGARNWVGRFLITRRALAYLFRRKLDKRDQTIALGPLASAAFAAMSPESPSATRIPNDSDEAIDRVARRIRERSGGVIAVVGERGAGKSTTLSRLLGDGAHAILLTPRSADLEPLALALSGRLGAQPTSKLTEAAAALAASKETHALLLDDADRFVRPVMGGLASFDALLAAAGHHARTTTWVLAFDHVIWPFLERARGARPLFDEVIRLEAWREEQIVGLLQARTEEAGLSPSFEGLLEPLPASADDVDKQEALAQRAADYYRLLWDAATGNPGVALHMWRCSLGTDAGGSTAVRPLSALETGDLERLPDTAVFVLRAVLQLAPAGAEQLAKGTLIRGGEVEDALRYAAARGYIEERDGGYRVTWTWFRAITLFLQRKHLLVTR